MLSAFSTTWWEMQIRAKCKKKTLTRMIVLCYFDLLLAAVARAKSEVQRFWDESPAHNTDILQWWKDHGARYPKLAKHAKTFLAIPATSVPSESVFSHAKFELGGKEQMKDDRFQARMELREWSKFMEDN